MSAMDPRGGWTGSRSEPNFFQKFVKKIDFADRNWVETTPNNVFLKGRHVRDLTNSKKCNFEDF